MNISNGDKWVGLKEYLKNVEKRVIGDIKAASLLASTDELRALGSQLALIGTILSQVERLDRDEKIDVGRPAPPKQPY